MSGRVTRQIEGERGWRGGTKRERGGEIHVERERWERGGEG